MNEEIKMDTEFFKAFAKDKTLSRAEFNKRYLETHKKPPAPDRFVNLKVPSPKHKSIYNWLAEYCEKFPTKIPNLVLWGATGTGKTFIVNTVKQSLTDKKVRVEYATAFNMVNVFQKYVNSFGRDDEQINDFLDCDVLIIDDLGTEPTIKNVTQEHIYNILNERLVNKRAFIITTNLNPDALYERYDERIARRITAKENSTLIEFPKFDSKI
ncbi:MAG: ATP-binding protein [Christensenellaceae bacterium]|nr:ATP-binding protein [Christensenellaceae bacterium]